MTADTFKYLLYVAEAMSSEGFSNTNGVAVLDEHLLRVVENPQRFEFPRRSSLNGEDDVASVVAQPHRSSGFSPQEGNNIRQQQDFPEETPGYTLGRHSTPLQYRSFRSDYHVHASNTNNYFHHPDSTMSLSDQSRTFMLDANYPQMQMHDPQEQEEIQHEHPRYPKSSNSIFGNESIQPSRHGYDAGRRDRKLAQPPKPRARRAESRKKQAHSKARSRNNEKERMDDLFALG